MRVLLVGPADRRARLRAQLGDGLDIVGEVTTLAAARASHVDADAWLVANSDRADGLADAAAFLEPLTHREQEVLELLAEGLSNKSIAARLAISDQTVKFHVAAIYGKLGAVNRTDAVRQAFRRGLIAL